MSGQAQTRKSGSPTNPHDHPKWDIWVAQGLSEDEMRERITPRPPSLPTMEDTYSEAIDMQIVYAHVRDLPDDMLAALERGPLPGTECRICRVLKHPDWPNEGPVPSADQLVNFHGIDALKCGVIYGMAYAERYARWRQGIEKLKRDYPEAYPDA